MFLDRVNQLGLLDHDQESNILQNFPLSVRKILVSEVSSFLLQPSTPLNLLSSRSHILWVLETCGQGFRLPIEEDEVISNVTELYRQWILDQKKRPPSMTKDFQFFLQIMLKQYSQLFQYRTDVVVEKHAQLCSNVLNIFQMISRVLGSTLSPESWEIFLKLLVGIVDSLFLYPRDPSLLGLKLCNQSLRVLFECWLYGQTQKPEMWANLKDRVSKWTHIPQTIVQWQQMSIGLTSRAIRLMYGGSHGTENVIIRLDGDAATLSLPNEYVFYSWHRILTLLGDLNAIPNSNNHLKAFQGIESLVTELLNVKSNLPENVLPPDGNTILHLFGKWLFEAIQTNKQGFDDGTALAIKILSAIFTDRKDTIFLDTYLASYYRSLQEVLLHEGKPLVSAILNTQGLLIQGMTGSRILIPYYLYAITRIVVGNVATDRYFNENVRAACYQIIRGIFSFPKYFGETTFKLKLTYKERQSVNPSYHTGSLSSSSTPPAKSVFEAQTYAELLPHLDYILFESMKNETNVLNVLSLLQLCYAHACLYISTDSEFAHNIIHSIVGKCVTPGKWGRGVTYAALKTIGRMATLFPQLPRGKELAKKIVAPLCNFAIGLCQELYRPRQGEVDKQKVRLTVQTYLTITDWIMEEQWIINPPDRLANVLDAVSIGIYGPKQKQEEVALVDPKKGKKEKGKEKKKGDQKEEFVPVVTQPKKITQAARFLLENLFNKLGIFPPPGCGASSVSTLVTEEELVNDIVAKAEGQGIAISDKKQFVRAFMMQGRTIVTVVDQPYEEGGPMCTIILRDVTGRYCWQFVSAYLSFNEREIPPKTLEHCAVPVPISASPYTPSAIPLEESRFASVSKFLNERKTPYDVFALTKEMCERESLSLNSSGYHLGFSIAVNPPPLADAYVSNSKFQQSRLLLTQLGFLSLESWGSVAPLELTTNFFSQLKILDQVPERECFAISVVYVGAGQPFQDALSNVSGSVDFQEFVSSLGWGIHLPTHTGYLGGLDRATNGTFSTYYANYATEIVFHVSTLIPNSNQADKLRLIGGNSVTIVWTENPIDDYEPDFGKNNKLHLVIHPVFKRMTFNLYQVKIFLKSKLVSKFWGSEGEYVDVFGPAMDGMILCKHQMGVIVRETATEACFLLNESLSGKESFKHIGPFSTRERVITDILKKFRVNEPVESFIASLFAPLPSKYVPPLKSSLPSRAERYAQKAIRPSSSLPLAPRGDKIARIQLGSRNLDAVRSIPPPLANLESVRSVPHSSALPPPLDIPSTRRKKKDESENDSPRRKTKKSKGKEESVDGSVGEGEDELRGSDLRRFRSTQEQTLTWATAEDRKRVPPLLSPFVKESASNKISMSSQRIHSELIKEESPEHTSSTSRPPRPPKLSLPHLEDLDQNN